MSAPVLVVFGLVAPLEAGPELERALARLEQRVVVALAESGFDVRPAPEGVGRPSAREAAPGGGDLAARLGAHRLLRLDLSADRESVWITHHLRAVPGAWDVREVPCDVLADEGEAACPDLVPEVLAGLRGRTHLDVDVGAALRARARRVTRCVRAHRRRESPERGPGELALKLVIPPEGRARVAAVRPERAASSTLAACLRRVFGGMSVGPFEGPPLELSVPVRP